MIAFFARHPTAANLLMLFLLALGLLSAPQLRRETFPDFATNMVQVTVPYPGAGAEEVEEAICQRLEDAIEGVPEVDELRCEAREGIATATADVTDGADPGRALDDIRTEVEAIDDLPETAERPVIKPLNRTDRVVWIAVTGPMAATDLKVYAEQLRQRLVHIPEVSEVTLGGFSDRQIRIELNQAALRAHGLSVADVARVVARQSLDLPAGAVDTDERSILIRFADQRRTVPAYEDLVVIGGPRGAELRLGDIATVTDRFELDEAKVLLDGERAALLKVTKTKREDTLRVMAAVQDFLEKERRRAPPGVTFAVTQDVSSIVQDRLDMLRDNGVMGFALVFLVMWLFFSFRFSFWVALGLPVAFAGTLFGMQVLGLSLNMITMVALLIAVGLLMDDAIVIAENIATHLARGTPALEATLRGVREVGPGVFASFITTVCVFGPLMFLEGNIGKVMRVLPMVLILALSVSLIEAFLILPHHLAQSLAHRKRLASSVFRRRFDAGLAWVREGLLGRLVDAAVAWRYLTVGVVIGLFLVSLAMVVGGVLKFRAFPELDGDVLEARILLPQGTPLARTEAVVAQVTEALARVDAALTPQQPADQPLVRQVSVRFGENADAFESGPHLATVAADLLGAERRNATIAEITELWRREVGTLPDVLALTFKEPQIGPAGLPIDICLQGADLATLKAAALDLQDWLAGYRGVHDLQDDLRPGKPEIRLHLREGALGQGLDAATLAAQLRAAYFGETAAEIQVGRESFEIDVRLDAADRGRLGDLEDFPVTLPDGSQAPLSAVAVLEAERGVARILRVDGVRTVTVRGDIDTSLANANEILADTARRFLPELQARYPDVSVSLEGEAEEQAETGASLRRAFLFGLLGIFILLSFQFRSYVEPVIVMTVIPLALIGVVWGHLALGYELSMPSMIGFVSLAGIVVNNAILLVAFVKMRAREGRTVVEAARLASRQRFRAILLSSTTTIVGMLPLLAEASLQAQVLKPLVASLAFGLMATTLLVLIVIPCLYAILHDFGLTALAREDRDAARAAVAAS